MYLMLLVIDEDVNTEPKIKLKNRMKSQSN